MKTPREFWIDEGWNGLDLGWYQRYVSEFPERGSTDNPNVIHVIESTPLTRNAGDLLKHLEEGLMMYEEPMDFNVQDWYDKAKELIRKAEGLVRVEFNAQVLPGINDLNACIKRSELIPLQGKFVKVTVEELP